MVRTRTVIPEEHRDNWYWQALYDDGTSIEELEDDGTLHGFQEIDQGRLVGFILRPLYDHLPQHAVQITAGTRLVFFRKRRKVLDLSGGEQRDAPPYQCIGLTRNDHTSYLFIDVDGNAVLTTERDAV